MSQQLINIGLNPNDRSGDLIRTAFDKVNQNFTELYSSTGLNVPALIQTGDIVSSSNVVWTSSAINISSAKLVIQAEASEVADSSGWHSQSCEAILACRGGLGSGAPAMTVYGNVYTSTQPLVTFTAQRNITTNLIEIIGTKTAACNSSVSLRIHSIEISTRD
jgi:hypothetical protein